MARGPASSAGASRSAQEQNADRLGRRDLLVLKLELRRRRPPALASTGRRADRRGT